MAKRRKYGRPKVRRLNQENIKNFLNEINFETEHIEQEWRHLLAFGNYQNKPAVLKLATTQTTGKMTQNEFDWNYLVHLIPQSERANFTVPQNYHSGFYGKLFYFIAQRFVVSPLAVKNEDLSDRRVPVKLIAKVVYQIQTLQPPDEYLKKKRKENPNYDKPKRPLEEKLLESSTEWASQVPRNLDPFLRVLEEAEDLQRIPAHGDFVIRQLYPVNKNVIGVIDLSKYGETKTK